MATPTFKRDKPVEEPLTWGEMDGNLDWIEEMLDLSISWAQGAAPPNPSDPDSKSAKTWSEVSEGFAERSQDWSEGENPPDPDDPESKSAKTWSGISEGEANRAEGEADRARDWAESDTPPDPGDPDSASAKSWAAVAGGHEQQSQVYAAAAQAAVGAPALEGNARKALAVKTDELGVEWFEFVDLGSPQTIENKTQGPGTSESVSTGNSISITGTSDPFQHITLTDDALAIVDLPPGFARSIWINPATHTITWPESVAFPNGADLVANAWNLVEIVYSPKTSGPRYLAGVSGFLEI